MTKIKAGNIYMCLKDIKGYGSFKKGKVYQSLYDNALVNDNHIEVKVTDSECFRVATEREIVRAELQRRMNELYGNKSEHATAQKMLLTELISFVDKREPSIPEIVEEHFWEMLGEDTDKAAESWIDDDNNTRGADYIGVTVAEDAFKAGARWQYERIMKDSVLCGGDGWFINNKRNCRKNGRFHKYYESTITHDKPLPMENGKDYRLIVIKGD